MRPFDYAFKVGDRDHVLRYSFAARRAFEKKHKMSVTGLMQRLADPKEQRAEDVVSMLLLLLSSTEPHLTADDVSTMIDEAGGEDTILSVLTEAIGTQAQGEGGAPNP